MINKLLEFAKRPGVFEQSSTKFWDDEHISNEMLKCHLHPTTDAASRNHSFIDKSVDWIRIIASPQTSKKVLDLGCGPGMYAKRLSHWGYSVTGIDFSKRSVEYARNEAYGQGYNIEYIYEDYLEIEYSNLYDLVLLIYCDFGVLSDAQIEVLLERVYKAMKEGGKFIFDVFTPKNYEGKSECNNWYMCEGIGFWKPETHICLESHYVYENNIRLDQYVIIDQHGGVDVFRIWDHCYTKEIIMNKLEKAGFKNIKIYSDVSGRVYDDESKTMCVVAEK